VQEHHHQGAGQQQQQQQEDEGGAQQQRDFLLGRCAQAARHLISDQVVVMHAKQLKAQEQQRQQQQGVPARMRYLMSLVQQRFGGRDNMAAATAALRTCSPEGVCGCVLTLAGCATTACGHSFAVWLWVCVTATWLSATSKSSIPQQCCMAARGVLHVRANHMLLTEHTCPVPVMLCCVWL
jgi:hypothetical protein